MILFLFFQFLLFFPLDLSYRMVVSPSLRFPHTSNSFCYDMRPVSIDREVIASIDDGLLVSFDGIRPVSIDAASAGPLST
ncbi:hypothetical protein DY000_02006696 [Brassica cretica]|uniref:Secreted protein n=1 Tax=Brassica cretica TaxID=69181 RepID=A0ABQ7CKK7_BRACR|nr:hypothetical protein DY000_02006696 [Brassica cretica]